MSPFASAARSGGGQASEGRGLGLQSPTPTGPMLPPGEPLLPGGGHGGGALELGGGAGDGDAAGVLEAERLLGLPQQLPEHGVVEVHHGHHVPERLPGPAAADVHRHLPLGGLHRLAAAAAERSPAAVRPAEAEEPRQRPPPPQHGRQLLGLPALLRARRVEAEVAAPPAPAPAAERPPPRGQQLAAEPEPAAQPP
uniref:Uncharacterized protein n=1 Tax=Triticum urartu TaxID=4572 RepID=A0A8R7PHR2_TRIUA